MTGQPGQGRAGGGQGRAFIYISGPSGSWLTDNERPAASPPSPPSPAAAAGASESDSKEVRSGRAPGRGDS